MNMDEKHRGKLWSGITFFSQNKLGTWEIFFFDTLKVTTNQK